MSNGNPTGIRVYNIRQVDENMLFDVEYISTPSNRIIDVNLVDKVLTINTTPGLIGKNLEIGFNNKDYTSFRVSSEEIELNLAEEPYLAPFTDNIKEDNNGFNMLNIRLKNESDSIEKPYIYNYSLRFIDP